MGHELAGEFRGDEVDVVFVEGEAGADPMEELFDVAIGHEVPFGWGKQHLESPVLEAENRDGDDHDHGQNPEQHLSKLLEMLAEAQSVGIVVTVFAHEDHSFFSSSPMKVADIRTNSTQGRFL